MKRHSFWVVSALALALAAPAVAQDNEKEKNQNRARRERIYGDEDFRYDDNGRFGGYANMRFHEMDRNRDGVITRSEWRGDGKSFRQHDLNRNGVLSGREVWAGYRNDGVVFDGNRDTFGRLDRNRDGVLDGREFPYGSTAFARWDRNNDGVIENWEYRQ